MDITQELWLPRNTRSADYPLPNIYTLQPITQVLCDWLKGGLGGDEPENNFKLLIGQYGELGKEQTSLLSQIDGLIIASSILLHLRLLHTSTKTHLRYYLVFSEGHNMRHVKLVKT